MASLLTCARRAALLLALAPAACFQATSGQWAKEGVDSAVVAHDQAVCQREARQLAGAEAHIDQDIIASRGEDWQRTGSYAGNVAQMNESNAARERAMVDRCMRAQGYIQPGKG